jgi:hypothetical protein
MTRGVFFSFIKRIILDIGRTCETGNLFGIYLGKDVNIRCHQLGELIGGSGRLKRFSLPNPMSSNFESSGLYL